MNRMFFVLLTFLGLLSVFDLAGQENVDFSRELKFIQHLQARGNYNEALFLLDHLHTDTPARADSIHYLKGWLMYSQKDLETSVYYLTKVSQQSSLFEKSNFFAAYNLAYLDKTLASVHLLKAVSPQSSEALLALKTFELAGISLLDRRLHVFDQFSGEFSGKFSYMAVEEQNLIQYRERIRQHKSRSPFVAGALSAAVPGLGKMYAGKTSEGISALLYIGAMSLASWDLYNRLGARNPFFILSAGITSVFYIGSIWGSAATVNRVNKEFNYEINQRILLDMHIPLRKFFP